MEPILRARLKWIDRYQYTAVDDCSRWHVLGFYKRRTADNSLDFIDAMVEQFPFPI